MMSDIQIGAVFFFSSRRRHTRSYGDWSSDVCSSDLARQEQVVRVKALYHRNDPIILGEPPLKQIGEDSEFWALPRSEERRVGKECRSRCSGYHWKKNRDESRVRSPSLSLWTEPRYVR